VHSTEVVMIKSLLESASIPYVTRGRTSATRFAERFVEQYKPPWPTRGFRPRSELFYFC
jgi:hypothetical protein